MYETINGKHIQLTGTTLKLFATSSSKLADAIMSGADQGTCHMTPHFRANTDAVKLELIQFTLDTISSKELSKINAGMIVAVDDTIKSILQYIDRLYSIEIAQGGRKIREMFCLVCNLYDIKESDNHWGMTIELVEKILGGQVCVDFHASKDKSYEEIQKMTTAILAPGPSIEEFNAMSSRDKWKNSERVEGIWICPKCWQTLQDGPHAASPFAGTSIHCDNCHTMLTSRTGGGQNDPFNWVLDPMPEFPISQTKQG